MRTRKTSRDGNLIYNMALEGKREGYLLAKQYKKTFPQSKLVHSHVLLVALKDPGRFKLMFSSALEEERDHSEFKEISLKNISLLEDIIAFCQQKGQLPEGEVEIIAIKPWSSIHGFTSLIMENQFPPKYLQGQDLKDLLKAAIS